MKKVLLIASLLLSLGTPTYAQSKFGTISTAGVDCSTATRCVVLNIAPSTNTITFTLSGSFTGTFQFEYSTDLLTPTWAALQVTKLTGFTTSTSATTIGSYTTNSPIYSAVRVRASALSVGSATVSIVGNSNNAVTAINWGSGSGGTIGTVNQGTATDSSNNWTVNCVVGCTAGTSDPDDGSIATGQTNGNANALNMVYDGSVWRRLTVGTAGTGSAQVLTVQGNASGTAIPVTVSNVNANGSATSANSSPVVIASDQVAVAVKAASGSFSSGAIASGAVASGAIASGAFASGAFAAQSYAVGAIPPASGTLKSGVTSAMTGTTSTAVIAAQASNYLYVSSCSVNNTHATTDTLVNLQDGSGGTVLWTFTAPHLYGGESHTFSTPLKVPTLGNGLFAVDVTTSASVIIACQGFYSTVSY